MIGIVDMMGGFGNNDNASNNNNTSNNDDWVGFDVHVL